MYALTFPLDNPSFTFGNAVALFADGNGCVLENVGDTGAVWLTKESFDQAYISDDDQFEHTIDLTALPQSLEERNAHLNSWFWSEINETLMNPFIDPQFFEANGDIVFTRGSEAELVRLVRLFILTEPNIEESAATYDEYVIAVNEEEANESALEEGYHSERIDALLNILDRTHAFTGISHEYCDESHDRLDGYSTNALNIYVSIRQTLAGASARDRMRAHAELRVWLESQGEDPAIFCRPLQAVS